MTALEMGDLKKVRVKYSKMLNQMTVKECDNAFETMFFQELSSNITQGRLRVDHVEVQLELLEKRGMHHLLTTCPEEELGPLQLAAFFYKDVENEYKDRYLKIIKTLIRLCPDLIWRQRTGQFEGQNVLHIAIVNRNVEVAEILLKEEANQTKGHRRPLLKCKATGSAFENSVMMGQLPLATAALTFNESMVNKLIENGAKLYACNSNGDTVFHTLVRYAALCPDKMQDAQKMMLKLHKEIETKWVDEKQVEARDVWLIENNERLTALRLAAVKAQPELFKLIHNLHGVYRNLDCSDGLFDSQFYDITELDPVALRRWADLSKSSDKEQLRESQKSSGMAIQKQENPPTRHDIRQMVGMKDEHEPRLVSVLEAICETKTGKESLSVLDTDIVRKLISLKWEKYRCRFWIWAVLHFVIMVFLSALAVYKSKVVSSMRQGEQPAADEENFAFAGSILTLPMMLFVPLEFVMKFQQIRQFRIYHLILLKLLHHNGTYRVVLALFLICVFADAIWYLAAASRYEIYIQVFVLLSGWWFMTFFFRPFKKFSFFTVMLQKILFGDMLRFFFIIALMLLAFTLAMYTTYLITSHNNMPPAFSSLQVSFLTMFQLLLGLADSGEVLPDLPNKGMATFLYAIFLLLTYVLMLNALIAMMSNTCTKVSDSRERQYELQRLSVVLMLENLLPVDCMMHQCGQGQRVARFDFRKMRPFEETRFFLKVMETTNLKKKEEKAHLAMTIAFSKQKNRLVQTINSLDLARLRNVFRLDSTDSQQSAKSSSKPKLKLMSVSIPDGAAGQWASSTRRSQSGKNGRQTPIQPEILQIDRKEDLSATVSTDPRGQLRE